MFFAMLKMTIVNVQWVLMNVHDIPKDTLYYQICFTAGQFILYAVILILLWLNTDRLVKFIAGNINDRELIITSTNLDLYKVALLILGVFLLATSVPELLGLASYHLRMHFLIEQMGMAKALEVQSNELKNGVMMVAKILAGLWLVLGTRGIVKAIDNVMNAPISKVPEEP
jgi:hypothetical protein